MLLSRVLVSAEYPEINNYLPLFLLNARNIFIRESLDRFDNRGIEDPPRQPRS